MVRQQLVSLKQLNEALEKRGSIDFSKQVAKARAILKRSKLYI